MAYLYKQKLLLSDLVEFETQNKRVLIYEPEEYLAALYGSYLRIHDFEVKYCQELDKLSHILSLFEPHLLIFNAESSNLVESRKVWLKAVKTHFPKLLVVTTGYNLGNEGVRELMSAGISSHINRRLSRPQDIAAIVKTLLNN